MLFFSWLYTILIIITLPFAVLRLKYRAIKQPAYGQRIAERLAYYGQIDAKAHDLWIHAVSFGEVEVVKGLVSHWLEQGLSLCITTTTPTGSNRVRQLFGERVSHVYLPYELPCRQRQFLKQFQPKALVIVETELWPNLLKTVASAGLKIVIINARLSERSVRGYAYISRFMKYILSKVTAVLCQSDEDVKRFCQLGLAQDKVQMAGNLKFDGVGGNSSHNTNLMPPVNLQQRKCWIAASTHPGEEELVIQAHKRLLQKYPDLILILAPRHPERKMEISKLIATQGLTDVARSENVPITLQHQVFLLDTLGELNSFYRLTAIAFVGGSLVKHGGHNMLEPIMAGATVLTGPHVHNFTYIYKQLKSIDGMYTIENQAQLAEHVQMLLDKPEVGKQQVDRARGFVELHQGAMQKHLKMIEQVLAKS